LVTPYSVLRFRVLDQNEFWKDRVLGEKTTQLYEILNHYNGRCEELQLTLDLQHHHSSNGFSSSPAGELAIILNGLMVDMSNVPAPNSAPVASSSAAAAPQAAEAEQQPGAAEAPKPQARQRATISYFPSLPMSSSEPARASTAAEAVGEAVEPSEANGATPAATPAATAAPAATSSIEEPLPPGWEMRYDIYGRRYACIHYFPSYWNICVD